MIVADPKLPPVRAKNRYRQRYTLGMIFFYNLNFMYIFALLIIILSVNNVQFIHSVNFPSSFFIFFFSILKFLL